MGLPEKIRQSPVDSRHKGPLVFSLQLVGTSCYTDSQYTYVMRRYDAHVTDPMVLYFIIGRIKWFSAWLDNQRHRKYMSFNILENIRKRDAICRFTNKRQSGNFKCRLCRR